MKLVWRDKYKVELLCSILGQLQYSCHRIEAKCRGRPLLVHKTSKREHEKTLECADRRSFQCPPHSASTAPPVPTYLANFCSVFTTSNNNNDNSVGRIFFCCVPHRWPGIVLSHFRPRFDYTLQPLHYNVSFQELFSFHCGYCVFHLSRQSLLFGPFSLVKTSEESSRGTSTISPVGGFSLDWNAVGRVAQYIHSIQTHSVQLTTTTRLCIPFWNNPPLPIVGSRECTFNGLVSQPYSHFSVPLHRPFSSSIRTPFQQNRTTTSSPPNSTRATKPHSKEFRHHSQFFQTK